MKQQWELLRIYIFFWSILIVSDTVLQKTVYTQRLLTNKIIDSLITSPCSALFAETVTHLV